MIRNKTMKALLLTTSIFTSLSALSSENLLLKTATPTKKENKALNAEKSAILWTKLFLNNEFLPCSSQRYVFLPANKNQNFDILRMRYAVGDEVITISQTACVFIITVENNNRESMRSYKERMQDVEAVAKRILKKGDALKLQVTSENEKCSEGFNSPELDSVQTAPWFSRLFWRWENEAVSYAFIKDDGRPSGTLKGFDVRFNQNWF